jgi:hypothetical protein
MPSNNASCPAWTRSEVDYVYDETEWGAPSQSGVQVLGDKSLANSSRLEVAAGTTACAWIGSCTTEACRQNCPRALGMAYNESGWHPQAQAADGIGRGLLQWGGPAAPACARGFTGPDCAVTYVEPAGYVYNAASGLGVTPAHCLAYNPMASIARILPMTNDGAHWRPAGNAWNACQPDGTIKEYANIAEIAVAACRNATETWPMADYFHTDGRCLEGPQQDGTVHKIQICDNCGDNYAAAKAAYCTCPATVCWSALTDVNCCGPYPPGAIGQYSCNGETCTKV